MRQPILYTAATLGAAVLVRSIVRRRRRYDLCERIVVITGGSRGLGLVMAREFLALGARVAICARDVDELARAEAELRARGEVLAVPCDVTDAEQVASFLARVRRELGPVDVLVNNAGVIEVGPIEHMTLDDYKRAMATHFWAPLRMTLAVLSDMRERRSGRIINITSIGGKIAVPHLLPYTASKFALVGLSEGMRTELAKDGIYVTTVVPGLMRTGSHRNAMFKGQHRAEYTWFAVAASLPLSAMDAGRAARQIIEAMRHGDAEVVLSLPATVAVKLSALAPRLTQGFLTIVDRLLPKPGGIGEQRARGRDSVPPSLPPILTRAAEAAARRNNEL